MALKNLSYLNKYFIKYKWRFLLGVLFVSASNFFGILIPQKIRDSLNFVMFHIEKYGFGNVKTVDPDLKHTLTVFALTIIGFVILKGILMFLMRQTIIVNSRLIEYDMRKELYEHYQKLDLSFYKINKTGDLMSRITEDISKVRNYLGPGILYGINLISLFSLTIYAMFSVNATLAIYTLLPLPLLSVSIYYVSNLINKKSMEIQQQLATLTTIAQESYAGIRVLKSYGKENQFHQYLSDECENFRLKSLDLAKVNAWFFPLMILLINISTLLVLWVGGKQVEAGTMTAGNIAEFIIYVNMLTWPVTSIGWIASIVQEAEASQERINEFLNTRPQIESGTFRLPPDMGDLEFRNVGFTYKDSGIKALNNITLKIKKGEKIAIIGKTGAGKSTLADLILRLYDPDEGEILINNRNIKEYDLSDLRQKIGYVPQDVFLFSDNISNNISFGLLQDINTEKIREYAAYAAVKTEIERLPDAYDTLVGERGVTLSGGQKQRISIARALIKNPEMIILDDCLSAVDTETEKIILEYLNEQLKDKTAIIITHRLSALLNIDKIAILHEGNLIAYDTPDSANIEELVMTNLE